MDLKTGNYVSYIFLKLTSTMDLIQRSYLYSSDAARKQAKLLAEEIGSWHLDVPIDGVVSALLSVFQTLTGKRLHDKVRVFLPQYHSA